MLCVPFSMSRGALSFRQVPWSFSLSFLENIWSNGAGYKFLTSMMQSSVPSYFLSNFFAPFCVYLVLFARVIKYAPFCAPESDLHSTLCGCIGSSFFEVVSSLKMKASGSVCGKTFSKNLLKNSQISPTSPALNLSFN